MGSRSHKLAILLSAYALGCKGGVKASVANNAPAAATGQVSCLPTGPFGPDCPAPALKITDVNKIIVQPGDNLVLKGENFRSGLRVKLTSSAGDQDAAFVTESASQLNVKIPTNQTVGLVTINLTQDGVNQRVTIMSDGGKSDFPVTNMTPDLVCGGLKFYDGNGTLQVGTRNCGSGGSASGCNVDGQVGCLSTADFPAIKIAALDPWNLRHGVTTAGVVGRLPLNCRNTVAKDNFSAQLPRAVSATGNPSIFTLANHGLDNGQKVRLNYDLGLNWPASDELYTRDLVVNRIDDNTFSLLDGSTIVTATSLMNNMTVSRVQLSETNKYSTLDHALNYMGSGYLYSNPWPAGAECGGLEVVKGDTKVWRDVTLDATLAPSSCSATQQNCAYLDKISNLTWTKKYMVPLDWANAMIVCDALDYNGKSDWRLPTQLELMAAAAHGAVTIESIDWIPKDTMLLSSTTVSPVLGQLAEDLTYKAWQTSLADGLTQRIDKSSVSEFACVR
ncbi:MAG: DUF1566 domain-containing protein [Deltaproteobacteria bacterium]|nr:DUF1566 domain-containing protein [Deltaproteobacteria bacterium]